MEKNCPRCRNEVEYGDNGIGYCSHCEELVCNRTLRQVIFRPAYKEELIATVKGALASQEGTESFATDEEAKRLIALMENFFNAVKHAKIILPGEKNYERGNLYGNAELIELNNAIHKKSPRAKRNPDDWSVNTFYPSHLKVTCEEVGRPALLLKPYESQYWQHYAQCDDGWQITVYFDTDNPGGIVFDWENIITPSSILKLIQDGVPAEKIF
ncbi:MAG: hypothetical protein WCO23_04410 [bacterium]